MASRLKYKDLYTERLHLRLPRKEDYPYQIDYLSNKENFPYADYTVTEDESGIVVFFDRMMKGHLNTSLFWMITLLESDEPIGTVSAWNVDWDRNSIEFGYSLYPKHRKHGYMLEALSKVMNYCLTELMFTEIDIWTDEQNESSIELARRLGFEYRGIEEEQAKNSPNMIRYATFTYTNNSRKV
ncbi:MAG: GNAT family N-acetyltransferase [Bacilli bacterium]|nr:GNAT family N-acetyltransferase [Bacilli bacterium]